MFKYILIILNISLLSYSFKPVVLLHGILTNENSMEMIGERIKKIQPETIVYNINDYSGWGSLESMWTQVVNIGNILSNISQTHPEGVNFIGYSQGGLVGRVILQTFPNHSVHNFISLSSPQAGQYGTAFLHLIFPSLVCKTAYELFYSRVGQHTSVGNYWNDPYEQILFYKYSVFLPFVNNDVESTMSESFKEGILKLKKLVLIGGPDDGVITPWQSSQFGYFNENAEVVEMKERDIYKADQIGLKTLDQQGKLHLVVVPGVTHYEWHLNDTITDTCIIPYLE